MDKLWNICIADGTLNMWFSHGLIGLKSGFHIFFLNIQINTDLKIRTQIMSFRYWLVLFRVINICASLCVSLCSNTCVCAEPNACALRCFCFMATVAGGRTDVAFSTCLDPSLAALHLKKEACVLCVGGACCANLFSLVFTRPLQTYNDMRVNCRSQERIRSF